MKNPKKISLIFITLFFSILFATSTQAQTVQNKINFNNTEISAFNVKYFKVYEANNILYFKFLILENNSNIAYILESSTNGIDYHSIQVKEGFKSPNQIPLLYCYSETLNVENTFYRIKRISIEGNINYSCPLTINPMSYSNQWIACNNEDIIVENQEEQSPNIESNKRIRKNETESTVSIYPNPNSGHVNIDLKESKKISIRMFNINGQVVHQEKNIIASPYQFEFKGTPGTYFLEIDNQGIMNNYTLIKQ